MVLTKRASTIIAGRLAFLVAVFDLRDKDLEDAALRRAEERLVLVALISMLGEICGLYTGTVIAMSAYLGILKMACRNLRLIPAKSKNSS